jgi:hypothetical protein
VRQAQIEQVAIGLTNMVHWLTVERAWRTPDDPVHIADAVLGQQVISTPLCRTCAEPIGRGQSEIEDAQACFVRDRGVAACTEK